MPALAQACLVPGVEHGTPDWKYACKEPTGLDDTESSRDEKNAFIAFRDTSGKSEKARQNEPSPLYIHRLRRSGRAPALPYPPSRQSHLAERNEVLQTLCWYPQSGKRVCLPRLHRQSSAVNVKKEHAMGKPLVTRRSLLQGCAAGTAALVVPGLAADRRPAANEKRPNIVLIVTDDHGRGDLGCWGNAAIKTPNLDALAAEGVRLTHAFCTTASCSPSRSVILSGLYNHANGMYGLQHSYHHFASLDNVRSLPVLLAQAGYHTARIGKYHVAPEEVYHFETVLRGNERNAVQMADNCREFLGADGSQRVAGILPANRGRDALDTSPTQDQRPFFLYFCTSDPHRGGGRATDLPYQPDRFGNRAQGYPGVEEVHYDPKDVIVPDFLPDIPECRAELAQYYQSVSRVDQGVGRLIEHLKKAGKYDNTVIIYISDNGIPFPGAKTTVYEPGINLPCIVRTPGQKNKGIRCDAMVTWADLTPTILDFAGATPGGSEFHGRSFRAVLEREHVEDWDTIYASHTFHEVTMYYPMRVVRERRFKLIWNIAAGLEYPFASDLWGSATWQATLRDKATLYGKRTVEAYLRRPRFELYDLETDPHEVKNLADDPQHQDTLARLKTKLKAFQQRTKDPWLLKWDRE
jgi:N-sulfoglucosamine sulfohydrolase